MKHLLLTTIAAVLLVVCVEAQQSSPPPESKTNELVAEVSQPEPTKAKAPDISIHKAAEDGNIEAVKQYLTAGADLNLKKDLFGSTPLHSAALKGRKEVAELLIAKGADVNAKDEFGFTALDRAVQLKRIETADLLRKHGGKTGEELKAEGK